MPSVLTKLTNKILLIFDAINKITMCRVWSPTLEFNTTPILPMEVVGGDRGKTPGRAAVPPEYHTSYCDHRHAVSSVVTMAIPIISPIIIIIFLFPCV